MIAISFNVKIGTIIQPKCSGELSRYIFKKKVTDMIFLYMLRKL